MKKKKKELSEKKKKLRKRLKKSAIVLAAAAGGMLATNDKALPKLKSKRFKSELQATRESSKNLTNHFLFMPDPEAPDVTTGKKADFTYAASAESIGREGKAAAPRKKTSPEEQLAERLLSLSDEIPMTQNEYVKKHIDNYVVANKNQVRTLLKRSEFYFPIADKVFKKYGVPEQLRNLAVVESELKPQARSHMGAVGLWQIMPATGRELGLKVSKKVDQRKDPYLATEAAAKYFSNLYDIYGDWLLVIAAYNCGPGNVNKAIRKAGGEKDFWAIRKYLPKETQNYVPKFIAATYAMNFHAEHDISAT